MARRCHAVSIWRPRSGPTTSRTSSAPACPKACSRTSTRRRFTAIARLSGETVATGLAFDLDGDCGIYNVSTLEQARRRGLGTAITAQLVHDARARGCRTASLQSSGMAEGVYAAVGFRNLGRFLEYVPAGSR